MKTMSSHLRFWLLSWALLGGLGLSLMGLHARPGVAQDSAPDSAETASPGAESPETDADPVASEPRFTCQLNNGEYTVMYRPQSQPDQAYPWAIPEDMGSAWPAERRCNEISRRLEFYRPDGLLALQTDVENGYNTVCVTTEAVSDCRIVFTVPEGQDPVATRDRVFENLALADQGEATTGVNTFAEGDAPLPDALQEILGLPTGDRGDRNGINLKPFLDPADGGTGTQLTGGSAAPGQPLDPDNFR